MHCPDLAAGFAGLAIGVWSYYRGRRVGFRRGYHECHRVVFPFVPYIPHEIPEELRQQPMEPALMNEVAEDWLNASPRECGGSR